MTNEGLKFGALALGIALVIVIIVLVVRGHKDKYDQSLPCAKTWCKGGYSPDGKPIALNKCCDKNKSCSLVDPESAGFICMPTSACSPCCLCEMNALQES